MDKLGIIRNELDQASEVLNQFLNDPGLLTKIETASEIITRSFHSGGKVLSCGNGGSHCDAMHFAEELTGKFRDERKPFPAISISDPSYLTCVGNDYGFEHVFSRYIEGIGKEGDVLLVLSTSGNSENVLNALDAAKAKGMKTIALTGQDGGRLAGKANVEINVPFSGYADRIQEIHIKIIHILILLIEKQAE
jgi:D-sedoheptulose 7-phosphate isomerase